MNHKRLRYLKSVLLPCLFFSLVTGLLTGLLIFGFRVASGAVVGFSASVYAFVRENPAYLPLLILGAVLIGFFSTFILKNAKNCRGGGIPTSVALLRGLIEFRWLKSIFLLSLSALLSFLGGVPLGNEGPSVQMGTAVGKGTVRLFGKKHKAWERYMMTGGACGGFAVATGAPLTGILFAIEEAHRRFSPLIFIPVALTVTVATATMRFLCRLCSLSPYLFDFSIDLELPLRHLWIAALVGIAAGLSALLFTKLYARIGHLLRHTLRRVPFTAKIVLVFALVSVLGFASAGFLGSGHDIIHEILEGEGLWYLLLIFFCVRALLLMLANHAGISGGLFVPTLTFGALLGTLLSRGAVQLGLFPQQYVAIPVVIGMVSFLAASSRTPLAAISFAFEVLCGLSNALPIALGVTLAFLVIEMWGVPSWQDQVIELKVEEFNEGKTPEVVDTFVTVMPGAFAVGKEVRDILWPPTCTVLSIEKRGSRVARGGSMDAGDILHIHYRTYDREATREALEAIVGHQLRERKTEISALDQNRHVIPDV